MGNHPGGDIFNQIIALFDREGVWELLGFERSRKLILEMVEIGRCEDCPDGDMLEKFGPRFQICGACFGRADEYREGKCPKCYSAYHAAWDEHTFKNKPPA